MKIKKLLMVFTMAFLFILTSCSIQNRVYMSGYHIEWKNWKQDPNKQELVSNDKENPVVVEQMDEGSFIEDKNNEEEMVTVASTDNSIIISAPKSISLIKREKLLVAKSNTVIENKAFTQSKITNLQKSKKVKFPDDTSYGFLYMLLIVFLFISIIVLVLDIISGIGHIARLLEVF